MFRGRNIKRPVPSVLILHVSFGDHRDVKIQAVVDEDQLKVLAGEFLHQNLVTEYSKEILDIVSRMENRRISKLAVYIDSHKGRG